MKTDLQLIIAEGEGQKTEFKERFSRLDRELVAFANASGGNVFLGIADDGQVPGIELSNEVTSRVQDIARNCDPPLAITIRKHAKERVLEIRVAEGKQKPHQCSDGFFLRTGPNSQKLKRHEILEIAVSTGAYHFDETLNQRFRYPQDFSEAALSRFLDLAGIETKADPQSVLLSLDVAEARDRELSFRQAGVLFFADKPQRFLKESMVTCVRYQGSDRFGIIDRAEIQGDPITMVEESLAFLRRNMSVGYEITGSAQHRERYTYPLPAVREAIVNAIMHRDYFYDGSHTYVHLFSDRMEIENPGGLPPGLTIDDLGKRSVRRNRTIADLLYRVGFVERIGSGIQRMERELAENGNPPMEISATNFFLVRFLPRVQTANAVPLSARQNRLYQFAVQRGQIAKAEAAEHLGMGGDTALREIKILMDEGLLRRTGTGKATRYVVV